MKILNIRDIDTSDIYREFLRVPALSMGLYQHAIDAAVPQQPHGEDEMYFVISGRGMIEVGGTDHAVSSGSVVYVPARVPHHFHTVTEPLQVLVLFAPAEGTGCQPAAECHSALRDQVD
jgi:quercetin dioxygenase-like cupin family protein